MTLDVVIPTWNKADLVLGCLASLQDQENHRAIVVDNGSTDGTVEKVLANFPATLVVPLATNVGFGRAVNAGIRAGDGEIVVVLNNDVVALPGFLAAMSIPFQDPAVDSVAGVLLTADGASVDAAGIVADAGLAGYSHLHGLPTGDISRHAHEPPLGPCGGAAAYRRSALLAVGPFDEEIFAYSEDLDLALRMFAADRPTKLAADARVLHLGSATLGVGSPTQLRLAGWARGYILGRYRVALPWLLVELAVAMLLALGARRSMPITSRLAGFRRGRALPPRQARVGSSSVGLIAGLRRRLASWSPWR